VYWQAGGRWRAFLAILLLSPFYANVVVKVFGWMVLLAPAGLVNRALMATGLVNQPLDLLNGYLAVVIVSVHRAMPFLVLLVATAMATIDRQVLEAARVCGASPARVFRTVIVPLSLPGAVAGGVLVFSLTVAAYVVPVLVGGGVGGRFLAVLMYQQMAVVQNWPFGAAVAVILLAAALLAVAGGNRAVRSIRIGRLMREGFPG
jgi:putative spermidine/putrescine transport system permease protein